MSSPNHFISVHKMWPWDAPALHRGGGAFWVCSLARSFEHETIVQLFTACGICVPSNVAPTPVRMSRAFFFASQSFVRILWSCYKSFSSIWPLRWTPGPPCLPDPSQGSSPFHLQNPTRRFLNRWTGGVSERGERWEQNRRRWQKRKGVSSGRKEGGDVKSEPRGAVMIGAVLTRPACAMPCVRWTTGFGENGPHSAGFTQMLASAPHPSRLWQRAGSEEGPPQEKEIGIWYPIINRPNKWRKKAPAKLLTSVTVFIGRNISNKGVISSQLWPWNSIWREANETTPGSKTCLLEKEPYLFSGLPEHMKDSTIMFSFGLKMEIWTEKDYFLLKFIKSKYQI